MNIREKRLFDHVVVFVTDLDSSKRFYQAIVETLGHTISSESSEGFFINELEIRQNTEPSRSIELAFQAENPGSVKLFYETALRLGGKCLGGPGIRDAVSFSAQVADPDGNQLQAVFKKGQKAISISY